MSDDFVFPQDHEEIGGGAFQRKGGLTKRELFAAIFASHQIAMVDVFQSTGVVKKDECVGLKQRAIHAGIDDADALLAELEKPRVDSKG